MRGIRELMATTVAFYQYTSNRVRTEKNRNGCAQVAVLMINPQETTDNAEWRDYSALLASLFPSGQTIPLPFFIVVYHCKACC
jgi:hypothetical protein